MGQGGAGGARPTGRYIDFLEVFPLFVVLSFLLRTTLAQPQALHVCIDEAKTVFTGRLGTFSVRWDAEGTTPPLAMGRRYGHPNYYSSLYPWLA